MTIPASTEVLILGGGPVGSTAGMVLAKEGISSILIEWEHHPRFHIGESLLPHSLPMFDRLGVHDAIRARRQLAFDVYAAIEALPMPVIAVVDGMAVGSGVEIAACCDFVIATTRAQFRTPEALWGTVGATQRLPRIIGTRLASDLMFTGRTLTAMEALHAGLVSRIVEPADLSSVLDDIASTMVKAPPETLAAAKRCITRGVLLSPTDALALEQQEIESLLQRGDGRLSAERFAARRP